MGVSFIKKAQSTAPTRSLKYLLHKHLNGPEPARSLKRVHASELTRPDAKLCPRMYALSDVTTKQPKDGWLITSENVTFRMGRRLQDDVVNDFADMKRAMGHWRCIACNHLHEFCMRPMRCEVCGVKAFAPVEVRFESAKDGESCGVDMLAIVDEPKMMAVEIKTIDKDQFKTLAAPLAEHRLRTNLYLRIIAESDHPWATLINTSVAKVFYVSKGGYGCLDPDLKKWGLTEQFSPFKEFEVKRNDVETNDVVKPARAVKLFREGKVGMPCGVCPTAFSKRAMACGYRTECFSGDYPGVYEWEKS